MENLNALGEKVGETINKEETVTCTEEATNILPEISKDAASETSTDNKSSLLDVEDVEEENIENQIDSASNNAIIVLPEISKDACETSTDNKSSLLEVNYVEEENIENQTYSAPSNAIIIESVVILKSSMDVLRESDTNITDNMIESEMETSEIVEINDENLNLSNNSNNLESGVNSDTITEVTIDLSQNEETQNKQSTNNVVQSSGGLGLLAQYNSEDDDDNKESDEDSVVEVPIKSNKVYRKQVIEINSDTDSNDSSSDSDSDCEYLNELRKVIDKTIQIDNDDDDDEDDGDSSNKTRKRQPPKVKGEMLLDDLPPIQDLHITVPENECVELGRVQSIVDQLVLVNVIPNSLLLDLDTVLFLNKGKKVLGEVFDVLGQVADPIYCVRFNSNKQIHERGINIGDIVYVAPKTEHTQFVILSSLMNVRGSDASWENDIEPPPRYIDYSDDEQERGARSQLRNKDRPNDHNDQQKRQRVDSMQSNISNETEVSSSPSVQSTYAQRGRRDWRGGASHNIDNRTRSRNLPNSSHFNYRSNSNRGSWHSNYYPNIHTTQSNFNMRPPPINHRQQNNMFTTPPPNAFVPMHRPPAYQQQRPGFDMNPYAMQRPMERHESNTGTQRYPQNNMYPPFGVPPPPPGV